MADNYLERRMEDLKSGRLAVKHSIPGIKPGSRRVVVAGGTSGKARDKVLEYRRQGCRVAVLDPDEEAGKRMAYEHGVRFHRIDPHDMDSIARETHALLDSWRGIDIMVGYAEDCAAIKESVDAWNKSLPIPPKHNPDIIVLN